jgi:hypothetical protein
MTETEPHSRLSRADGETVCCLNSDRADDSKMTIIVSSAGTDFRNHDTDKDLSCDPITADVASVCSLDVIKSPATCQQTFGQSRDVSDANKSLSVGDESSVRTDIQRQSQKLQDSSGGSFGTKVPSDSAGSSRGREGSKMRESVRADTNPGDVSNEYSVPSAGADDRGFSSAAPSFNAAKGAACTESVDCYSSSAAGKSVAEVAIAEGALLAARQESEVETYRQRLRASCSIASDAPETDESVEKTLRNCDSLALPRTSDVGNVANKECTSVDQYSTGVMRNMELPAASRSQVYSSVSMKKPYEPPKDNSSPTGFNQSEHDEAEKLTVSASKVETADRKTRIPCNFLDNSRSTEPCDIDIYRDDDLSCDKPVKLSKPTVGVKTLPFARESLDADATPLFRVNGQCNATMTDVAAVDSRQEQEQQHAQPVANDEDYSVCTEDDEDDYYFKLISSCPTSRSLAAELAAAESGLRKLAGADSRRGSCVSSAFDADSRRGSRLSAFDDDSRRNSGTSIGDDDFAAEKGVRDGLPLDDVNGETSSC